MDILDSQLEKGEGSSALPRRPSRILNAPPSFQNRNDNSVPNTVSPASSAPEIKLPNEIPIPDVPNQLKPQEPEKHLPRFRGYSVSNPDAFSSPESSIYAYSGKKLEGGEEFYPNQKPDLPPPGASPLFSKKIPEKPSAPFGINPQQENHSPQEPVKETIPLNAPTRPEMNEPTNINALDKIYSATTDESGALNRTIEKPTSSNEFFPQKTATQEAQEKINSDETPKIRTYEDDTAEAIRDKNASVIDIALAEKRRRELYETEDEMAIPFAKSALFITVSILLIVGGIFSLAYYYFETSQRTPNPTVITDKSFIAYDLKNDLLLSDLTKKTLLSAVQKAFNQKIPENKILEINLTGANSADKKTITTEQLFSASDSQGVPSALLRALDKKFMLGVHNAAPSSEKALFLILKTDSYDNSFAGMLRWEKRIVSDIGDMFTPDPQKISTTTSAWTIEDIAFIKKAEFNDEIIKNKDVRAIKNDFGKILFLYSFIDSKTIVITTNAKTLSEIVARNDVAKIVK